MGWQFMVSPLFKFSKRSLDALQGVRPEMILVASRALAYSTVDFAITEGLRSKARQAQLFQEGASRTLNSKHLTGHAVDVAAYVDGTISWEWELYVQIDDAFQQAADELGLPITWGGTFKTLKDGAHFELS